MLRELEGSAYLARVLLTRPQYIRRAKEVIRKAFLTQIEKRGFSLVEILSPCPTNWKMTPAEAVAWVEDQLVCAFPPGEIKEWEASGHAG